MLDIIEISDLMQYQQSMPDCREKELLNKLLFEYGKYAQCGTYQECQSRLEWLSYSIDDVRKMFETFTKGMQEEVENIRSQYQPNPTPKKRGRKPKNGRNESD